MICLACGNCCKTMSPLTDSETTPCPLFTMHDSVSHCERYQDRPIECANHDFPMVYCPIGQDVLHIDNEDAIRHRIKVVRDVRNGGIVWEDIFVDEILEGF